MPLGDATISCATSAVCMWPLSAARRLCRMCVRAADRSMRFGATSERIGVFIVYIAPES